jgi:hypothetical protein
MLAEFMPMSLTPKKEIYKNIEDDIVRTVLKKRFFESLSQMGLDMEVVINGRRNKNEQFHRFNLFVKDMYESRILMQDIFYFMEEDMFDTKTVLSCFNEENLFLLREELAIKYSKKKKSNLNFLIEE